MQAKFPKFTGTAEGLNLGVEKDWSEVIRNKVLQFMPSIVTVKGHERDAIYYEN
jgi:hypothetical protein